MNIDKIENMKKGWFIGNFVPSIYATAKCEVAYMKYKQGEKVTPHYHKIATEINMVIRGCMEIQGRRLIQGDIFTLHPYEITDPIYFEDTELIVVKIPSVPGDKYEITEHCI